MARRLRRPPPRRGVPDVRARRRRDAARSAGLRRQAGPTATSAGIPVRPGYAYVIWKGRHVAEPTELSAEEAAGFWADVARVAGAVDAQYRPAKMNWLSLGNGVPHLHVHLVPRPPHDRAGRWPARAGGVRRRDDTGRRAGAAGGRSRRVAGPSARLSAWTAGRGPYGRGLRLRRGSGAQARPARVGRPVRL